MQTSIYQSESIISEVLGTVRPHQKVKICEELKKKLLRLEGLIVGH